MHKLREAMAHETVEAQLAGEVEIDGAYFGGQVRPTNAKEDRVDRRLLKNRSSKRRVVIVLRQRGGRTLTRSFLREAEGVMTLLCRLRGADRHIVRRRLLLSVERAGLTTREIS